MTNESDWTDSGEMLDREYGASDTAFGWVLYVFAVLLLVI